MKIAGGLVRLAAICEESKAKPGMRLHLVMSQRVESAGRTGKTSYNKVFWNYNYNTDVISDT